MAIRNGAVKKLKILPQPFLVPEGLYALPVALILYQKSSGTLWANPAFEKTFGSATAERFEGGAPVHLIRERPVTLPLLTMVGRHEGLIIRDLSQNKVPVELKVTHYEDPSVETYLVLVEDVTAKVDLEKKLIENHMQLQGAFSQLKNTQSALVQSAKLASLGELSSGIAHELNQPLQAIMGFSQELSQTEKLSPVGTEFLDDIINASKKMAEIIRSLRSFAREAGEDLIETSVEGAAKQALRLMHHTLLQKNIEVELQVSESLPLVIANPIQLEQVLINLFSNACDAIETRFAAGDSAVTPGTSSIGQICIQLTAALHAGIPQVNIQVKDTGCGMDEATQVKIFDPFYTTKEVGKGTGLGLSISYGILQRFKAEVEVTSRINDGTTFLIHIPTAEYTSKQGAKS
jgi:C4-dicarboxylate-specific signal transduction histidine kinase